MLASDLPVTYWASSTAYCLRGTMADGSQVRPGSVASDIHPFGTRLTVNGVRYVVRDRTDGLTQLDIWMSSCWAAQLYSRRMVKVTVGWWVKRGRLLTKRHGRLVRVKVNMPSV